MKKTKAKRKLISSDLMHTLHHEWCIGVPVPALIRKYELDISRPALVTLLRHCTHYFAAGDTDVHDAIKNSLFPPWWDLTKDDEVQENPEGWSYEGEFPLGRWVQDENN